MKFYPDIDGLFY